MYLKKLKIYIYIYNQNYKYSNDSIKNKMEMIINKILNKFTFMKKYIICICIYKIKSYLFQFYVESIFLKSEIQELRTIIYII